MVGEGGEGGTQGEGYTEEISWLNLDRATILSKFLEPPRASVLAAELHAGYELLGVWCLLVYMNGTCHADFGRALKTENLQGYAFN